MRATSLFDLSDKVAIVTGGNGGLGLGMAMGLAQAAIAIAARRADRAEAALAALEAKGANAIFVETDVADRAACFVTGTAIAVDGGCAVM